MKRRRVRKYEVKRALDVSAEKLLETSLVCHLLCYLSQRQFKTVWPSVPTALDLLELMTCSLKTSCSCQQLF